MLEGERVPRSCALARLRRTSADPTIPTKWAFATRGSLRGWPTLSRQANPSLAYPAQDSRDTPLSAAGMASATSSCCSTAVASRR